MKKNVLETLERIDNYLVEADTLEEAFWLVYHLEKDYVGDLHILSVIPGEIWNIHLEKVRDAVPQIARLELPLMPTVTIDGVFSGTTRYRRFLKISSRLERAWFMMAAISILWGYKKNKITPPYGDDSLYAISWKPASYVKFSSQTPEQFLDFMLGEVLEGARDIYPDLTLDQLLVAGGTKVLLDWVRDKIRIHTDYHQKTAYIDIDGTENAVRGKVIDDMRFVVDNMMLEFVPSMGFAFHYLDDLRAVALQKPRKPFMKLVRKVEKPILKKRTR